MFFDVVLFVLLLGKMVFFYFIYFYWHVVLESVWLVKMEFLCFELDRKC